MILKKNIFQIAIPIFIELLFFMLLGTIDMLMLNAYDKEAYASVINSTSITNLFNVLLTVVATGVVVVLTKLLGSKNKDEENKVVGTGLIFNILLGLVISLILFLSGSLLLEIMKTDIKVIDNAKIYIRIISFGFTGLAVSQACGAIFRSYGKPLVIMGVAVFSNIVNIIINYTLIFGKFGFKEYGVQGAAIGTLTSNLLAGIISLVCLYFILDYHPKNLKFCKKQLKNIFKIGIPSAFEYFLFNFSQFLIMIVVNMILINNIEGIAVVARGYVVTMLNYVMLFSLAIANSNQIIAGYYVGENNYLEARNFTFKNYRMLVIIIFIIVGILNIFWKNIIGLLTDDQVVIESLRGVFIVALVYELGRSSNIMFIAALRTVNDIIFPIVIGVISMYGLAVVFSYILAIHFNLGVLGIFIAQAMDESFRGTFMFFRWKNKDFNILQKQNQKITNIS